jgi:hypothetical protein
MSNAFRRWSLAILAGLRHAADPLRSVAGGGRHSLARRLTITAVPVVLVVPLVAALAVPGSSRAAASATDAGPGGAVPTVNWALSGQATANSTETGYPASNAVDGDAGTDWCTSAWTGSLVVDLGQVRSLSDLGITLDAASPSASATIQVASQAGDWQTVPAASNVALDPGNPMYIPLPRGTQARYAQLTVYSDTGADVCVGEFRTFGPDRAAANMDLGTDLSFTPQELAAGAKFTCSTSSTPTSGRTRKARPPRLPGRARTSPSSRPPCTPTRSR